MALGAQGGGWSSPPSTTHLYTPTECAREGDAFESKRRSSKSQLVVPRAAREL